MTIDTILATAYISRDEQNLAIYELIGIDSPGAAAILEPDGRLMVWASENDSLDDDGANATYRSKKPISDGAWQRIQSMAWIDEAEAV